MKTKGLIAILFIMTWTQPVYAFHAGKWSYEMSNLVHNVPCVPIRAFPSRGTFIMTKILTSVTIQNLTTGKTFHGNQKFNLYILSGTYSLYGGTMEEAWTINGDNGTGTSSWSWTDQSDSYSGSYDFSLTEIPPESCYTEYGVEYCFIDEYLCDVPDSPGSVEVCYWVRERYNAFCTPCRDSCKKYFSGGLTYYKCYVDDPTGGFEIEYNVYNCIMGSCPWCPGVTTAYASGQNSSGAISGQITTSDGGDVPADSRVIAYFTDDNQFDRQTPIFESAGGGTWHYFFGSLTATTYTLHTVVPGYKNSVTTWTFSPGEPEALDFTIHPGDSQNRAEIPFYEDFETGILQGCWVKNSTGTGRILITGANDPLGYYHLTMDSSVDGTYGLNELLLTANLDGEKNIRLSFIHKEFGDEDNPMPATFTGSNNSDGVAISADGNTWYKVQGLVDGDGISSDYKEFTVNLDAAVQSAGIEYNSSFWIKFQQYDNFSIPTDGFAFDNIQLFSSPPNVMPSILPLLLSD
jgi:hypothetical protein